MTPEEARIIAWTLLGEAGGEGRHGMEAVAHVIRNRAGSGRFPSNPAAVSIQANGRGIYQFSAWNNSANGGNHPRATYPVGSAPMREALEVVAKVFGPTPGKDPTQGATHYYSPRGMPNGEAPYWWQSEAPRGGKQIGNHIFAVRHVDQPVTMPTPRPDDLPGRGPAPVTTAPQRVLLPPIPPRKTTGYPTELPEDMQVARASNVTATWIYDPVKKDFVPKTVAAPAATAKERQIVAGFSVPSGTAGVARTDMYRQLEKAPQTFAGQERTGVQTRYGPAPVVKDETRLAPGVQPAFPGGARSRDSIAQAAAGQATAAGLITSAVAPVMPTPVQQRPVVIPQPAPPIKVVVQRDPVARTIREDPRPIVTTQTGKQVRAGTEYTGTDGYNYRVERDGTITNLKSGYNTGSRNNTQSSGHRNW